MRPWPEIKFLLLLLLLEYACPVWHTNLPKYLSDNIELIQKRALESMFPGEHYTDILNDIDMCTFIGDIF